jgi:nitroreductase
MKNIKMIQTLLNHRSIRKYKSDPIPENILSEILQAAVRGSNTGNMQVYSIIVTRDAAIREQLWEQHFKQDMVKQAPVHLTFCADFNRFNKWCELRNAEPGYDNFLSFFTASVDAVIAAQNAALAAEAHGLGICYLGTVNYNAERIIEILNLPKGVVPVAVLSLGYSDEQNELTPRLPLEAVVHYEKYHDFSSEDIQKIYLETENSEFTKNLILENKTENLAQIFTQKRYTKTNNINFSKHLLRVLENQGFMNHEE